MATSVFLVPRDDFDVLAGDESERMLSGMSVQQADGHTDALIVMARAETEEDHRGNRRRLEEVLGVRPAWEGWFGDSDAEPVMANLVGPDIAAGLMTKLVTQPEAPQQAQPVDRVPAGAERDEPDEPDDSTDPDLGAKTGKHGTAKTSKDGKGGKGGKRADRPARGTESEGDGRSPSTPVAPSKAPEADWGSGFDSLDRHLWSKVGTGRETELAATYVGDLVRNRGLHDVVHAYRAAPDVVLLAELERLAPNSYEASMLRLQLIRARAGLREDEDQELVRARTKTETELLQQLVDDMREWRKLAKRAPGFLLGALIGIAAIAIAGMVAVFEDKMNGYEISVLLFVLVLAAVTPTFLLLRGRLPEGLNKWSPAGRVKGEEPSSSGDGRNDKSDGKDSAGAANGTGKSKKKAVAK